MCLEDAPETLLTGLIFADEEICRLEKTDAAWLDTEIRFLGLV